MHPKTILIPAPPKAISEKKGEGFLTPHGIQCSPSPDSSHAQKGVAMGGRWKRVQSQPPNAQRWIHLSPFPGRTMWG